MLSINITQVFVCIWTPVLSYNQNTHTTEKAQKLPVNIISTVAHDASISNVL